MQYIKWVQYRREGGLNADTETHLMSMPTCQNACTVALNWLHTSTNASLTSPSADTPCDHSPSTSCSCFVRLSKRETARWTSVSERDWELRLVVDGEDGRGDTGEEEVEETVHVESADAGRRAV